MDESGLASYPGVLLVAVSGAGNVFKMGVFEIVILATKHVRHVHYITLATKYLYNHTKLHDRRDYFVVHGSISSSWNREGLANSKPSVAIG